VFFSVHSVNNERFHFYSLDIEFYAFSDVRSEKSAFFEAALNKAPPWSITRVEMISSVRLSSCRGDPLLGIL
jgi:hypothetical protein